MRVYGEFRAWDVVTTSHVGVCLLYGDFSVMVQKAAFECSGYRWKAQPIASQ